MWELLQDVLHNFLQSKASLFGRANVVRTADQIALLDAIPKKIEEYLASRGQAHLFKVKGSIGNGNIARVPWVGIFRTSITKNAENGYYIVLLFSEDMSSCFLSLNQGITAVQKMYTKSFALRKMTEVSEKACVHNAFWSEGMAGSLRCGLTAARLAHADLHGIVVSTCDQPNVPETHLLALVEGLDRREIAASVYDGIVGVPAAFSASMFAELLHAQGDRGAREVIRRDPARVLEVPCEGAAHDVDSAVDVVRLGLRLA